LLCILLISACLDRVADPPALNPHSADIKGLCPYHAMDVLTDHAFPGLGLFSLAALRPVWVAAVLPPLETRTTAYFPAGRHASDLSPPAHFHA
jgi:hypothetical protein